MSEIWKLMMANLSPWFHRPAPGDREATTGLDQSLPVTRPSPISDDPNWYPRTFQTAQCESGVGRPQVFEPALKQFSRAFRNGEPAFRDPEQGLRWRAARRRTIDHLLRIVGESAWKDSLILRGSLLLKAWLGESAREPGDMDWVITPATIQVGNPMANEMFDGLLKLISERSRFDGIEILTTEARADDIWTYERAPGRRLVFPWHAEGLPGGTVQLDFVFGEDMPAPAVKTSIPICGQESIELWTATPQLSLAWKLLWLETDMFPQGKDLYDAALLAEFVHLPLALLEQTLAPAFHNPRPRLTPDFPMKWRVDWDNCSLEYPWVAGSASDWQRRLTTALRSTFTYGDQ